VTPWAYNDQRVTGWSLNVLIIFLKQRNSNKKVKPDTSDVGVVGPGAKLRGGRIVARVQDAVDSGQVGEAGRSPP
jgi:hypothetical protein